MLFICWAGLGFVVRRRFFFVRNTHKHNNKRGASVAPPPQPAGRAAGKSAKALSGLARSEVGRNQKYTTKQTADKHIKAGDTDAGTRSKGDKWPWTVKLAARRTGKVCTCCGKTDQDLGPSHFFKTKQNIHTNPNKSDPCQPDELMAWGSFANDKEATKIVAVQVTASSITVILVTDRGSCWYLFFRIWATVYRSRWSLTEFKEQAHSQQQKQTQHSKHKAATNNRKAKGHAVNDQANKHKHWLIKQVTDLMEARIEN